MGRYQKSVATRCCCRSSRILVISQDSQLPEFMIAIFESSASEEVRRSAHTKYLVRKEKAMYGEIESTSIPVSFHGTANSICGQECR